MLVKIFFCYAHEDEELLDSVTLDFYTRFYLCIQPLKRRELLL